ncbi:hypothetical protein [Actinoplanes sp. NPDC026670]|uniref:hypothetical protein n=1 Tax=Actinoplanes sp. NPDC026670 TaxID=3154700 RepID=UPI0033D483FF
MEAPTIDDVLAFAARLTDEPSRADALADLVPFMPTARLGEIMDLAEAMEDEHSRGQVHFALVRAAGPALTPRLLAAAYRSRRAWGRALELIALLPRLDGDERSRAAEEAVAMLLLLDDAGSMTAEAVRKLVPFLAPERLDDLLTALVPDDEVRAHFLDPRPAPSEPSVSLPDPESLAADLDAEIAPYRLGDTLPSELGDHLFESRLIRSIAHLPPQRRAAAARSAIRHPGGAWEYSMEHIAPYLTQDDLIEAVRRASPILRARGIGLITPHLDRARLPEAFAAILAVEPEWARGEGLAGIVRDLDPDQADQAIEAALAIRDPAHRVHTLAGMLPVLPPDRRPAVTDAALLAVTGIPRAEDRAFALVTLAEGLPAAERGPALEQAFVVIRKDRAEGRWLSQLIKLLDAG